MDFICFILSGLASGILGGMGMGGGTILIPILTIFMKVSQHTSQALNLLSFIPMAIVALIIHFKNHLVKFKKSLFIIVPALASCVGGCYLAKAISGDILGKCFGGFLIALAILQVVWNIKNER